MFRSAILVTFQLVLTGVASQLYAQNRWSLDNVEAPSAIDQDEPLLSPFDHAKGIDFLDQAALDWTKRRNCFSCHTNYAYLLARPQATSEGKAHVEVRQALEEMVTKRWPESGPRWDAEVLMTAHVLALHDASTTGKLSPVTKTALDQIWKLQRTDGGFDWLKCGWPPMESDDDFAVAIVAIAAHAAPGNYAEQDEVRAGLEKLKGYLAKNPSPTLHHRVMLLWAESYQSGWLSADEKQQTIDELLKLQRSDGGWALATMGNWQRADGTPQTTDASDGYATGLALFVLHRLQWKSSDPAIVKGLAWLKSNQRESGRWFTRSLHKDNQHFIANAGSAFAMLAIAQWDPK